MSAPEHPRPSLLPGIAHLHPSVDRSACFGSFADRSGESHAFQYDGVISADGGWLTIAVDDESLCSFESCPAPHQHLWFASGLVVATHRIGIASNIYAIARDLLAPYGAAITPSGNLFEDGVKLWAALDPSMKFVEREDLPGYYRLAAP